MSPGYVFALWVTTVAHIYFPIEMNGNAVLKIPFKKKHVFNVCVFLTRKHSTFTRHSYFHLIATVIVEYCE